MEKPNFSRKGIRIEFTVLGFFVCFGIFVMVGCWEKKGRWNSLNTSSAEGV